MTLQESLTQQAQFIREEAMSKIRPGSNVGATTRGESKVKDTLKILRRIRRTALGIILIVLGLYVIVSLVFEVIEDLPLVTDDELYSWAFESKLDVIVREYLPFYGGALLTFGISPVVGAVLFLNKVFRKEEANPRARLHTQKNIVAATFLGGPLAGGYLISRNFRALGNDDAGEHSLLIAIIAAVVIFGNLPFLLPEQFQLLSIPVVSAAIVFYIVRSYQGQQIKEHLEKGNQKASLWKAVAVGLIALVLSLQFSEIVAVATGSVELFFPISG
jgi:hypothetical protein